MDYFSVIAKFHEKDEAALTFLGEHGVFPTITSVKCSNAQNSGGHYFPIPKVKTQMKMSLIKIGILA